MVIINHTINCVTKSISFINKFKLLKFVYIMTRIYSASYYKVSPAVTVLECTLEEYGKHVCIMRAFVQDDFIIRETIDTLGCKVSPAVFSQEWPRFHSRAVSFARGLSLDRVKELEKLSDSSDLLGERLLF